MNKNVALMAVLLGLTLVFSSFALAVPAYQMFAPAETSNELTIYVDSMDAFAAFTCPAKTGTCTPGTKACDEDLGSPPVLHACEYECTSGGTWGAGSECGTNMCYGGECNQGSAIAYSFFAI
jgi:hypothetical protein